MLTIYLKITIEKKMLYSLCKCSLYFNPFPVETFGEDGITNS